MPYENNFIGVGNLAKRPELKYSGSGKAYAKFTIAISKGKDDQKKTLWLDCTCFGGWAESLANNEKGHVFVKGELEQQNWEKEGQKRSKICLVCQVAWVLDPRKSEKSDYVKPEDIPVDDLSDSIPF